MAYPKQAMRADETPTAASPPSFWLLIAGLGAVLGLILTALDAPLWMFYAAPVAMAPFLVHELRRLDAEEGLRPSPDRPE
jgi:hypothetical protein